MTKMKVSRLWNLGIMLPRELNFSIICSSSIFNIVYILNSLNLFHSFIVSCNSYTYTNDTCVDDSADVAPLTPNGVVSFETSLLGTSGSSRAHTSLNIKIASLVIGLLGALVFFG